MATNIFVAELIGDKAILPYKIKAWVDSQFHFSFDKVLTVLSFLYYINLSFHNGLYSDEWTWLSENSGR